MNRSIKEGPITIFQPQIDDIFDAEEKMKKPVDYLRDMYIDNRFIWGQVISLNRDIDLNHGQVIVSRALYTKNGSLNRETIYWRDDVTPSDLDPVEEKLAQLEIDLKVVKEVSSQVPLLFRNSPGLAEIGMDVISSPQTPAVPGGFRIGYRYALEAAISDAVPIHAANQYAIWRLKSAKSFLA